MMNSGFPEPNDHIKEMLRKRSHKDDIAGIDRHQVDVTDMLAAVSRPMVLARSFTAATQKGKRIVFFPLTQNYKIIWGDEHSETSSSFSELEAAVEKYNEIEA